MDGLKTSGTRDRGKGRDWVVGLKTSGAKDRYSQTCELRPPKGLGTNGPYFPRPRKYR